jgi:hypothetical protein
LDEFEQVSKPWLPLAQLLEPLTGRYYCAMTIAPVRLMRGFGTVTVSPNPHQLCSGNIGHVLRTVRSLWGVVG